MAVTDFVTQFTYVSKRPRLKNREQKKVFRENCFENVVSGLLHNDLFVQKKYLKKIQQIFFFLSDIWAKVKVFYSYVR